MASTRFLADVFKIVATPCADRSSQGTHSNVFPNVTECSVLKRLFVRIFSVVRSKKYVVKKKKKLALLNAAQNQMLATASPMNKAVANPSGLGLASVNQVKVYMDPSTNGIQGISANAYNRVSHHFSVIFLLLLVTLLFKSVFVLVFVLAWV